MKLKIRNDKEVECEFWLNQDGDDIDLKWKNSNGSTFTIATIYPEKEIRFWDSSEFNLTKED